MDFNYKITRFDDVNKIIDVAYDDGGFAQIRLTKPLPKTFEDLENIIKQYTAPVEAIEARQNPDSDLSFIAPAVGVDKIASRFSLKALKAPQNTAPVADQNEVIL